MAKGVVRTFVVVCRHVTLVCYRNRGEREREREKERDG